MNSVDRAIQRLRFRVAARWITPGARVLDVGGDDGALFRYLGNQIGPSVAVDPNALDQGLPGGHRLVRGLVADLPFGDFDCCTALAVLEHLHDDELLQLGVDLADRLTASGTLVTTVPSPIVDPILDVMIRLRILDGMEVEQHHGVEVAHIPEILGKAGWRVERRRRFEFGLNNLIVFTRA